VSSPSANARAAAVLNLAAMFTATSETATQAASDFGTDFRITAGQSAYQIQTHPTGVSGADMNVPLAQVTVRIFIHHNATNYADELDFMTNVINGAFVYLMDTTLWESRTSIYRMEDESIASVAIEREGKVLTYAFEVTLQADSL
jgi:hypothetical protein